MRNPTYPLAAVSAILLLVGCSSSSGDGRKCYDVPPETMTAIADGANETQITPVDAAAVKSKTRDVYIVAMSFTGAGFEDDPEVGAWAIPSIESPGPIIAIDGMAHQFTVWPNEVNGEKFNVTEDGVEEAKACLEKSK